MKALKRVALVTLIASASALWGAADPGVTFIGRGEIPGNSLDKSGLFGNICQKDVPTNCIHKAIFGGMGSALTYTGHDKVFLAVPDRGPFDGRTDVPYLDRFHFLYMNVDTSKNPNTNVLNIDWNLLDTRFLKHEVDWNFVGASSAFLPFEPNNLFMTLRLDPEGVVVSRDGTFFVSDEYGPFLFEFNRRGRLIRRIPLPPKFLITHPSGEVDSAGNSWELYPVGSPALPAGILGNNSGRQANRGMEGLAITPNGRYLVGLMQNALIQDNGLNNSVPPGRVGLNNRIFRYDLWTRQSAEYVYTLDAISQGKGANEILAINDHEFLVLERDNRSLVSPGADAFSPAASGLKRIYKIDLNGATDVSGFDSLVGQTFIPVTKTLFLDLLNPAYEVDISTTPHKTIKNIIAEKIEGLAWGPKLPDGRLLLYVMSDNDLNTGFPTQIYAFAIDANSAGLTFVRQDTPVPLYPFERFKRVRDRWDDFWDRD